MKKSLFNEAIKIARSEIDRHPEKRHFLHWSFVVVNNKVVNWATNLGVEPPRHYGYHKRNGVPKTHSEIRAWLVRRPKVFELINVRLNKRGDIRLSKPCECCYELMNELGCTKFYYSSEVGFLSLV